MANPTEEEIAMNTPKTDETLQAVIDAGGVIGPEHKRLVDLARKQEEALTGMQEAIDEFCEHSELAATGWKEQPCIAGLFALRTPEAEF